MYPPTARKNNLFHHGKLPSLPRLPSWYAMIRVSISHQLLLVRSLTSATYTSGVVMPNEVEGVMYRYLAIGPLRSGHDPAPQPESYTILMYNPRFEILPPLSDCRMKLCKQRVLGHRNVLIVAKMDKHPLLKYSIPINESEIANGMIIPTRHG